MIKIFLVVFFLLGLHLNSFAIGIQPSPMISSSALELLKLPTENRRFAVQGKGEVFYPQFTSLAFNETQPMSLRWRALIAAAEIRGVKATEDLLKAAENKQWYMRNAALVALSEVNPPQAIRLAQKLLKDKALVVRSAAVEALKKDSSAEVRDLLWEELHQVYNFKNNQSLWVRHQIVEALAENPKNREISLFAQLLSDQDVRVQLPAIRGLERLTGVRLGEAESKTSNLVGLWQAFLKKEKVEL